MITLEKDRQSLTDLGFSYADISESLIYLLKFYIQEALSNHSASTMDMMMDKDVVINEDEEGLKEAFLTVSSSYFQSREAISFYSDGTFSIAGWATGKNRAPFAEAFARWLEEISH